MNILERGGGVISTKRALAVRFRTFFCSRVFSNRFDSLFVRPSTDAGARGWDGRRVNGHGDDEETNENRS